MPAKEEPRRLPPASLAPSSEPFYPAVPAAPISSTDYGQAPAVGPGAFGDRGDQNPYSGMGYDLLPSDDQQPAAPPAAESPSPSGGTQAPGFTQPPGFTQTPGLAAPTPAPPYSDGPPSVADLHRAPGNPYADHSGRAVSPGVPPPPATGTAAPTSDPYSAPGKATPPGQVSGFGAPAPASPAPGSPPKKRTAGCLAGAIAVLAIGALVIQGLVAFVSNFTTDGTDPGPTLPTVADTELQEGMCFDTLEYVDGNHFQPIACEEPHRFQVSRNVQVPGTAYPGEDEVAELASTECREIAAGLTDEFDTRPLSPHSLYPSEGTWKNGDQTITCFISVAGSQRLHGSAYDGGLEVH